MDFDFSLVMSSLPLLLQGALVTLKITALSVGLGLIFGLLAGVASLTPYWWVRIPARCYVDFIRGTPLLIQIFLIYFALPVILNTRVDPFVAAVSACSINSGAYVAEIIRGGLMSLDPGQSEAGRSLGLGYLDTMRFIVIPQAFKAILPSLGLGALFSDNQYVTIAIPLTVIVAVGIWVLLEKTKLGYELRATGCNKFAAKYCGMKEKRNIILTMAIAGGLAGMGAATLFLTGFEQWQVTQSAVPAMGFNGIAAAFLGGLNPIGAIFSSYFIQHITNGGAYVDKTMYSAQISDLISALIIYLCGFVLFFKVFMNSRLDRRDEKRRAKEDRPGSEEGGKA